MRWIPAFAYGHDEEALTAFSLTYPVRVWTHGGRTTGKTRRTATGVPAVAMTLRRHLLGVTLRFHEQEWPSVRDLLVFGQTGAAFLWYHGDINEDQLPESVSVHLDAPRISSALRPQRDSVIPWMMSLNVVFARADGTAWALEYFKDVQAPVFEAIGGTITEAGGYRIHTFLASDNFEVLTGTNDEIEVLLVGGGGKGGDAGTTFGVYTGGGGGGRVRHLTAQSLGAGVYPVVVGAGQTTDVQNNGFPSSFNGETAEGGGGGSTVSNNGKPGGSGGGGSSTSSGNRPGGAAIYGAMGNAGGNGATGVINGGGGGGATQAGGSAATTAKGGDGYTTDISGVNATYGGGGGGRNGAGGAGGGGAGTLNGGAAGTANTGGGGGGTQYSIGVGAPGGVGGSGIVIIRYPI